MCQVCGKSKTIDVNALESNPVSIPSCNNGIANLLKSFLQLV